MRYRPPLRVLTLAILTLGIYELVWIAQTRREIVGDDSSRGISAPKTGYFIVLRLLSLVWLLLLAQLAWSWLVNAPQIPSLSQQCTAEYALSRTISPATSPTAGQNSKDTPTKLSEHCKSEVIRFDAAEALQNHKIYEAVVLIFAGAIISSLTSKWLAGYAVGIEHATNRALSATSVALSLMTLPFALGIFIVQRAINRTQS